MTNQFQKIASQVSKLEGKKKQVPIGNIREVLSCLVEVDARFINDGGEDAKSPLQYLMKLSDKRVGKLIKEKK